MGIFCHVISAYAMEIDMKVHLVMPMGGAGSRFHEVGIKIPKPLIEIKQRPFFYWAAESIHRILELSDITFVVLKQHVESDHIDKVIKRYYPDAYIIIIERMLQGPVYTCMKGCEHITDDLPIIFNDCDHMFQCSELSLKCRQGFPDNFGGALLTFDSDRPQYSYIKYDRAGKIVGTVEKKVISNSAICGAYVFRNTQLFLTSANEYVKNCPYSECFMSGVYNTLLKKGYDVEAYKLEWHVEFGTPDEYMNAKKATYFNRYIR